MVKSKKPRRDFLHFLQGLREKRVSEKEIQKLSVDLRSKTKGRDGYACQSCGISSKVAVSVEIEGPVYSSPKSWVYCLRDGKPVGLCNHCFDSGLFEGFGVEEIAYFQERFEVGQMPDREAC